MYVVDGIAYAGEMKRPLTVVSVRYMEDYKLLVRFSTGETKAVDFSPLLDEGAFQALRDTDLFKSVYVDHGVPNWQDGEIDIAPECLYSIGVTIGEGEAGIRRQS